VIATIPIPEPAVPEPGAIVHVRQRLYLVEQVVTPPNPGDATLVRLSCVDDDAQGQALDVLWEHELDAEIRGGENWQRLAERSFDPPKRFAAYLNTLRWNCVTSTDPKLLRSPFRAGIKLDPYQLETCGRRSVFPGLTSSLPTTLYWCRHRFWLDRPSSFSRR
jgi:hypothetical protein